MNLLIRSAKVINPGGLYHNSFQDIWIEKGKIKAISPEIEGVDGIKEVTFPDLHVSLGWFDSSVSFGEPGYEERETLDHGLKVAASSGFTHVVLNSTGNPVPDTKGGIEYLLNRAKDSVTQVFPTGTLTAGTKGLALAELYDMHRAGAIAFGDYKKAVASSQLMKIALQYAKGFDGLIIAFANDSTLAGKGVSHEGRNSTLLGLRGIPALAENVQLQRDLALLEYTGGKMHIPTISTSESVELIRRSKEKGLSVSCSVAVHQLVLTDDALGEFDTRYKVLPPLRTRKEIEALIAGIKDGTIDMVTSDHTPLDIELKKMEFDLAHFGTIGLESAFGALNKTLGIEGAIQMLTAGRKAFNVSVPEIKEGAEACLTLFNPSERYIFDEKRILSSSKNSAFLKQELVGVVYGVIQGAKISLA